jgi:hypothetical protein
LELLVACIACRSLGKGRLLALTDEAFFDHRSFSEGGSEVGSEGGLLVDYKVIASEAKQSPSLSVKPLFCPVLPTISHSSVCLDFITEFTPQNGIPQLPTSDF